MNDSFNDQNLVRQVRRGHQFAFDLLMRAHEVEVYNLCRRLLGDATEAEDAAQECFVRAYVRLGQYDDQRSFRNWLLAIAQHYCVDLLRRRRLTWLSLDDPATPVSLAVFDPQPGPEEVALQRERSAAIQALLARLPLADRRVVVLRYWYGMTYQEIADAIGATPGAVKSRLHRARLSLAAWLDIQPQALLPSARRLPAAFHKQNPNKDLRDDLHQLRIAVAHRPGR